MTRNSAREFLLRHRVFVTLLLIGTGMRTVVQVAYRPGLEFFGDSYAYLYDAWSMRPAAWHPFGYSAFLKLFAVTTGRIWTVVVAQHLLGLAMAVAIYALLLRLGTRRWIAAIATIPVLLDAYQLDIEHFVLSETLVEVLLLAGLAVLVLRDRPGWIDGGLAGFLVAAAGLTRTAALPVLVVAGIYLLLRVRWQALIAGAVCAALPLLGYATWYDGVHGTFGLEQFSGLFLYGRIAPIAQCHYSLPRPERRLCQRTDPARRPGPEFYVWRADSPLRQLHLSGGNRTLDAIGGAFADTVIEHQPYDFAAAVLGDTFHYFLPGRPVRAQDWYDEARWEFPATGPHKRLLHVRLAGAGFGRERTHPGMDRPVAGFLRGYQSVAYTQGPLLLIGLLGAAVAGLGLFGRRVGDRQLRWAAAVFGAAAFVLVLTPSLTAGFDYRYGIPLLITVPPAGAAALEVGVRALRRRPGLLRRESAPSPAERTAAG